MVVVIIVSLLLSFGYVGFSQLLGRRSSEDMESLQHWLQRASDRAQLEGAVYGVHIGDQGLLFLTYRQGIWIRVLDQQAWSGSSADYELEFEATEIVAQDISGAEDAQELQPSIVFLPDGSHWPDGSIRVDYDGQTSWIAVDEQGQFAWTD